METLNDLCIGQSAVIAGLNADVALGRRLLDLGFTAGEPIQCILTAPCGEPRAYLACGAVIALRRASAYGVLIARPRRD